MTIQPGFSFLPVILYIYFPIFQQLCCYAHTHTHTHTYTHTQIYIYIYTSMGVNDGV